MILGVFYQDILEFSTGGSLKLYSSFVTSDLPPTTAFWSITVCPNCAYSLQGLPSAGICPECGRTYNQSEIVLYGYGRGRHENILNAKRSRVVWLFFVSLVALLFQVPQLIFDRWKLAIALGGMALMNVYLLYRRNSTDHPSPVQIRLNDRGCVQYDDVASPSLIQELSYCYGWLLPIAAGILLIVSFRAGWIDPVAFWIWFAITLVAAPGAWIVSHRFRKTVRQIKEGALTDANAAYYQPTAWQNISGFSISEVQAGSFRFRITVRKWISFYDPVDAEVRCTQDQARQFREMIRFWRAQRDN